MKPGIGNNPWDALTERDLLWRKLGCAVVMLGVPLVAAFWVVVILLMDKS